VLDVSHTAVAALPDALLALPRLRRVGAAGLGLAPPEGWVARGDALERAR